MEFQSDGTVTKARVWRHGNNTILPVTIQLHRFRGWLTFSGRNGMPFRFRKSFKIAKGLKINLSKSGISTTIGGRGASVNISKRGTRTTVGLPGTGLSYSSTSEAPGTTPTRAQGPGPGSGKTSNNGPGCLTGIFNLFHLPFRILSDLFKSIQNPQTRRSMLILVGVLTGMCFACFGAATLVEGTGSLKTPAPTLDANAIATNAMIKAWLPYTQTAAALIPNTGATDPSIPAPTNTAAPTSTAAAAFTITSTNTSTPPPTQTSIPTYTSVPVLPTLDPLQGVTAICNDGTYSYSQHRRGTCSHHGGVKQWINRPPN